MLELRNIKKSYGKHLVLKGISFTLKDGIYALLGPNGAGKSTMINIITDNLTPDSGEVLYDNIAIKNNIHFRRILGFMPQQQGLYDTFTGRRFLAYMCALKQIPRKEIPNEIERVASFVNLSHELDKRLCAYSGGMKQRALIAQAIIGDPKLLILDEPTAGLDPKERVRMRNMISLLAENRTVIVATHVVSDIESVAKEIMLMKSGEIIAKAKPSELVEKYAPNAGVEAVYMKVFEDDSDDNSRDIKVSL